MRIGNNRVIFWIDHKLMGSIICYLGVFLMLIAAGGNLFVGPTVSSNENRKDHFNGTLFCLGFFLFLLGCVLGGKL
jgi:hypothetical protein